METERNTIWIAMKGERVVANVCGRTMRDANSQLARYLLPYDVSLDDRMLAEIGQAACRGANPYRIVGVDIGMIIEQGGPHELNL